MSVTKIFSSDNMHSPAQHLVCVKTYKWIGNPFVINFTIKFAANLLICVLLMSVLGRFYPSQNAGQIAC